MTTLLQPTGSPAERFTSRNPGDFAEPSTSEEGWRFTPLARIRDFFSPFEPDEVVAGEQIVPAGAHVEQLDTRELPVFGAALTPADLPSAIAAERASRSLYVHVAAGTELAEPMVLRRTGSGGRSYAHHVVEIGANARATLILDYQGLIRAAANVEFVVGDGAHLTVVTVNDCDEGSIQLTSHAALVGRDATYRHVNIMLGGSIVRLVPTVRFAGPGGHADLLGVSFAGDGQHLESRLYVDHSGTDCSSEVLYKNALLGRSARTVWVGDVRIRPEATGTNTYELNRNLLLSDGARADSVPNLEIETGDIAGAGHASATGRFDDLQMFYLQSRGIPAEEARRLVVRGFFADIVARIAMPELEHRIMTTIEGRLGVAESGPSTETENV